MLKLHKRNISFPLIPDLKKVYTGLIFFNYLQGIDNYSAIL